MTTTTEQRTHKPWCTQHDRFDDGSADWCSTQRVQVGEVELVMVNDGEPPHEVAVNLTAGGGLVTLSLEDARRVHEVLGQMLAKAALSV
jgi:hypothetical protein